MSRSLKLSLSLSLICLAFVLIPIQMFVHSNEASDSPLVYYIPVEQTVERGLAAFMKRSFEVAIAEGADHIVLEIHTPGGAVDAAGEIARLIADVDVPITAFVNSEAISAGAYISLNADQIVMVPNASMGAAGVIDGAGNAAEEKTQSFWLSRMKAAAEINDRDPMYALAMADRSIEIPELDLTSEEFLTLTATEAYQVGYAEAIAANRLELLQFLGLENAVEREMEVSFSEQVARFVTHPVVIPILLSIGSLGLVLELYSPGFGLPGIMGLSALLLFFFGHLFAGFAGWESLILFVAGFVLIIFEVFVPGFGIFGLLGIAAIIGGMLLASFSTTSMLVYILISVIVTAIAMIFIFRYFGNRGPWKKIILTASTSTEKGYISNETKKELMGQEGETLTPLRPSGSAVFGDERLDVVTEGGYIERGKRIQVIYTSGSRIVVREVTEDN
ncbi:NfeD family protein [Bacillus solitudinis]|uniref:NfeD family protein n=1 Tax=Bacillus solitudinis TaxID=2014074 RepID=UPI000C237D77|nr:nodulation protein NfeD [Bacillus solitudinis]